MKAKRLGGTILFSATIGFSTAILATGGMGNQACNTQGGGMHQAGGDAAIQEMRQGRIDAKLGNLKEALALNPDQEDAWQAFEERVRTQAGAATTSEADDPLQARIARTQMQLERMKGMAEARDQLLAALTPEQAAQMRGFPGGDCR